MFNPVDITELLASNVKKSKNPFGLKEERLTNWCKDIDLKEEGEYLLFTGFMYQMIPYIENVTKQLEKYEDKKIADYSKFMKYIPTPIKDVGLNIIIGKEHKNEGIEILKKICFLLEKSKIDFFYKPELDSYSGILLYDLGDEEDFKRHAEYVVEKLERNNIKKIITVDPHTTYALKVLYPKYLGVLFEVKTYIELLDVEGTSYKEVIVHDPCFYGRYLKIFDVPRKVLNKIGVKVKDLFHSKSFTYCCGGPAESISPKLAKEIREKRIAQLENNLTIITMCPICFSNLRKASMNIEDFASFLWDELKEQQTN